MARNRLQMIITLTACGIAAAGLGAIALLDPRTGASNAANGNSSAVAIGASANEAAERTGAETAEPDQNTAATASSDDSLPPPPSLRAADDELLIEINGRPFVLEIAADAVSQARGLSGRECIDSQGGMIFPYRAEQHLSFWMKDCLVDIDIMYLDRHRRIVSMYTMPAEPPRKARESRFQYEARLPRYPSRQPAMYAVELQAGMIDTLNLAPGDTIDFNPETLTRKIRAMR